MTGEEPEAVERGPVEVYVLSEAYDLGLRDARPHGWGIDGRPARVGVRFPRRPGEVLLSFDGLDDPVWRGRALERLERGEFGGASESEAARLRMDRAASARSAFDRIALSLYRLEPLLWPLVVSHRPYTHRRGVLLDDPLCTWCAAYDDAPPRPPFYPCRVLARVAELPGRFARRVD